MFRFDRACRAGLVLTAMTVTAAGAGAQAAPKISATVVSEDHYPPVRVAFPGGVTGLPYQTYTSWSGYRSLKLDLYLTPDSLNARGPRPFIVFAHGGGWLGGSPRTTGAFSNWPEVLASFAARGYVVASVSCRLSGEATSPVPVQDVKAAIRCLRANANSFNVDKNRGLVWGPSAEGQVADLVGVSCGVEALEPPATESDCVQGVVDWYGVTSFTSAAANASNAKSAYLAALGCEDVACVDTAGPAASPVTYVDPTDPPILIIHGTADKTVRFQQAQELHDRLRANNVRVELLALPGIDHSFLGPTPEATRKANLTACSRTVAFIDQTIGDKAGR
jgi:acetyl esterase/lipase